MKMTVTKPSYKKLAIDRVVAIDISCSVNDVGRILVANHHETVFVTDSERHLHGVITMGDFFRRAAAAKDVEELLNKNYKKIETGHSEEADNACIQTMADKIFKGMPNIQKIPVVNSGKLLYAIGREFDDLGENAFFLNGERIKNLTSYDNDPDKETENPLIRVFVTTYNNVEFARYNLNGILMQKTDFPFEIYIYDDCSTDGTSDIIREYAKKHPNIIADIQPENLYSKNMELRRKKLWSGLKNHTCGYVAFADGDDYWTDPYKLQIQADFLENNSDFSMCSGGFVLTDNFNGKQQVGIASTGDAAGVEYNFATTYGAVHVSKNFTRMYRTDAVPEFEITQKYKYFIDVHMGYYSLTKGKGYCFSRIFGVANRQQGGVWNGLNSYEQAEFFYKVHEELYRETRDEQIKGIFLVSLNRYVTDCLKDENKRTAFYEGFVVTFPELSEEIESLFHNRYPL